MRSFVPLLAGALGLAVLGSGNLPGWSAPDKVNPVAQALQAGTGTQRFRDDAPLHAVQFLDADVGFAAGAEGVILKTINGGKTWELLPTYVRGSLRSIHMLTHLIGWVVGREELPYGAGSAGVVLFTQDGGASWKRILADTLPGLNHIRFGDTQTAMMVGDASDQFPTGVFLTNDGGRKWRPVKGPRTASWLGGDFIDGKSGALAGAWSRLGTLRDGAFGQLAVDAFGGRDLRGLQLRQPVSFAVGQGGLLLHSKSFGEGWAFVETKLPQEVLAAWDFHGVCCVGEKAWVVGRPGSVVLCSEDGGANWKTHKTGSNLPLNAVHFFDSQRGWAVGELGCILCTADGGTSWSVQRRGGQRAAALCVHACASDIPVDTVAMIGADRGLLTAAIQVAGPDAKSAPLVESAQAHRLAAAHRAAGGAAAEVLWQFPLSDEFLNADSPSLLKYWDQLHSGRAAHELLRQLVLALRIWQPDLVLTDHPDIKITGNAAGALVAEALHEAFAQAADPKAFPEQISVLGLQPWRVSKIYGLWDKRSESHVEVDNGKESSQLQGTSAEYAGAAARLLGQSSAVPLPIPAQRFYRLLDSAQPGAPKHLLDGMPFGPVADCRRALPAVEDRDPKLLVAIKAQRQLAALAKNPGSGLSQSPQLLGQLTNILAILPEDRGSQAASDIAHELARHGQWDLARHAFLQMVERFPMHPLSVDACRWLIRHNTSSEARRRHELGQFLVAMPPADATPPAKGGAKAAASPKSSSMGPLAMVENPSDMLHWHKGGLLLGKHLTGFGPLYANEASMQFCLQAANRRLGDVKMAQAYYTALSTEDLDGPWRDAAAQENWLANRSGPPPRAVAMCRYTQAKPYLDGLFNDQCWQGQTPIVLKDAIRDTAKDYPTEAMFAFDEKYLYMKLHCKHPAGLALPPAKERPRDADLRTFDRVSILLDLDRDYTTCFQLEVDQRGCVCEDCWGDKRWNPQWFVAIRGDDGTWDIEAAIPLHELTSDQISVGSAWALNVVRIIPGRGVQAMSAPAGVRPRPEGMGLMIFQREQ